MNHHTDQIDAILHALAQGDSDLADHIVSLTAKDLETALGDTDLQENFTGTITDKAGHKRSYVDGKPVAGHHDTPANAEHARQADAITAEIADHSDAKAKPALVARLKKRVARAVAVTHRAVYEIAYHSPQILQAWTDVFDHPDDLKKIGYTPSTLQSGGMSASHQTPDPVQQHLGLPAHLTMGLVVKIGSAVIAGVKKRLAGKVAESLTGHDPQAAAELIHAVLSAVARELGLTPPPTVEEIAKRLAGTSQS